MVAGFAALYQLGEHSSSNTYCEVERTQAGVISRNDIFVRDHEGRERNEIFLLRSPGTLFLDPLKSMKGVIVPTRQ
jgi:hypothetical protein